MRVTLVIVVRGQTEIVSSVHLSPHEALMTADKLIQTSGRWIKLPCGVEVWDGQGVEVKTRIMKVRR